jgi:hypothetical protein
MSVLGYVVLTLVVVAILSLVAVSATDCGSAGPSSPADSVERIEQLGTAARRATDRASESYLRQVCDLYTKDLRRD